MNVIANGNRFRKASAPALTTGVRGLLVAICVGVAGLLIQPTQAQSRDADLRPFVGTWQAKFKGNIFQTIKLEKKLGKLTGTISHADLNVDPKSGELTGVEVHHGSDAIVEAKLTGRILRITEEDDLQFDMKITGADQALLQIVLTPDSPTVKPWKLERVASQ